VIKGSLRDDPIVGASLRRLLDLLPGLGVVHTLQLRVIIEHFHRPYRWSHLGPLPELQETN